MDMHSQTHLHAPIFRSPFSVSYIGSNVVDIQRQRHQYSLQPLFDREAELQLVRPEYMTKGNSLSGPCSLDLRSRLPFNAFKNPIASTATPLARIVASR